MTLLFGYASGFLWLLSSAAWGWSVFTKPPVRRHPRGSFEGIELFSGMPDGEGMSINGLILPDADELFSYQRKLAWRNAIAAGLSGLAAVLACLAVATSQLQ